MRRLGAAALGHNEIRYGDNFHVVELHGMLGTDGAAAHVEKDDVKRLVPSRRTTGLVQDKRSRHVQALK
jgi:hypothetical protein